MDRPQRTRRPLTSYNKVQRLIAATLRNRAWLQRRPAGEYLDAGCGWNIQPGFVNLDYEWRPGVDLCWDLTRGLPLGDGSMRGVFSEHCLEHIPFGAIDQVLREFHRVLRPGGVVRIVVPDGEIYLDGYARGTPLPYAEDDPRDGIYSPIMSVNRIFREFGHQFIYDFDTLSRLLGKHGFRDIRKEQFMSGRDPRLLIDTESRAVESLYVEAAKGA